MLARSWVRAIEHFQRMGVSSAILEKAVHLDAVNMEQGAGNRLRLPLDPIPGKRDQSSWSRSSCGLSDEVSDPIVLWTLFRRCILQAFGAPLPGGDGTDPGDAPELPRCQGDPPPSPNPPRGVY
jgi:hypothetical protein